MVTEALTTDRIGIETATVELAVIRVGRKQMTQAVFKQLPYLGADRVFEGDYSDCPYDSQSDAAWRWQPPITHSGTLWGWVNVPIEALGVRSHFQWVLERDGKLYRVGASLDSDYSPGYRQALASFNQAGRETLPQLFIAV